MNIEHNALILQGCTPWQLNCLHMNEQLFSTSQYYEGIMDGAWRITQVSAFRRFVFFSQADRRRLLII